MHERGVGRDKERQLPIHIAHTNETNEDDLRDAWMEAAERLAELERRVGFILRTSSLPRRDEGQFPFLYVGDRSSLGFIGVVTRGMHHQMHHLMLARGENPHQ